RDVSNPDPDERIIHAIYLVDDSSHNRIIDNRFIRVSGAPIKLRNGSNSNQVSGSIGIDSGNYEVGGNANSYISGYASSGEVPNLDNAFDHNDFRCEFVSNRDDGLFEGIPSHALKLYTDLGGAGSHTSYRDHVSCP